MFRHRQQRRRWAALTLLLWLFGVGSGLAHACLLPKSAMAVAPLSMAHADVAGAHHHATTTAHAHHGEPDPASPDSDTPDQRGSPGRTNCQDFCDKSGTTMPSPKSAFDDLQGHALPFLAMAIALPMPAFQPALVWVPRRDGVRVSSIPIVLQRLAL
jgi:hypothetical protein